MGAWEAQKLLFLTKTYKIRKKNDGFSPLCPHLQQHEAESIGSNVPKDCQTYVGKH